jgi:hypothetical protein
MFEEHEMNKKIRVKEEQLEIAGKMVAVIQPLAALLLVVSVVLVVLGMIKAGVIAAIVVIMLYEALNQLRMLLVMTMIEGIEMLRDM